MHLYYLLICGEEICELTLMEITYWGVHWINVSFRTAAGEYLFVNPAHSQQCEPSHQWTSPFSAVRYESRLTQGIHSKLERYFCKDTFQPVLPCSPNLKAVLIAISSNYFFHNLHGDQSELEKEGENQHDHSVWQDHPFLFSMKRMKHCIGFILQSIAAASAAARGCFPTLQANSTQPFFLAHSIILLTVVMEKTFLQTGSCGWMQQCSLMESSNKKTKMFMEHTPAKRDLL